MRLMFVIEWLVLSAMHHLYYTKVLLAVQDLYYVF